MSSISQTVRPVLDEAWAKRSLGPPRGPRSESRTSTRTRVASLEKMHRTGSIKINQSILSKSGYSVERGRSRSESRSVSRPSRRTGSRDRWKRSFWTDNEDDNDNGKGTEGEVNFIKEKFS